LKNKNRENDSFKQFSLEGKSVIITGSGSRLGMAVAMA